MVTVAFLASVQGYQESRIEEVADRLRKDHPEWTVNLLTPDATKPLLPKYKLKFGPAILVNDRIEFVGIPRYRMLVERIAMLAAGQASPRTAQPPPSAAPAKTATTPAKPAPPPTQPATPSAPAE